MGFLWTVFNVTCTVAPMSRTFEPSDLIALPVLNATETCVLAQGLEAATQDEQGNPRTLPEAVEEARKDMKEAAAALWKELGGPAAGLDLRSLDRRVDRAFKALRYILFGWSHVEEELEEGDIGAEGSELLFNAGLAFLNLRPREQWGVGETKLQTITRENLEPKLSKLGVDPLLNHLRTLHGPYGEASGATKTLPPDTPQIQEKRQALQDAIRQHAVAVQGSVIRKKPETKELADLLLRPLTEWVTPAPRKKEKPSGETSSGQDQGSGG
jgi:hypothetical protein